MSDTSAVLLALASTIQKACFDYTPQWKRGNPNNFIDSVTFPKVLADKNYSYRVVVDGNDLGTKSVHSVADDGSQKVNLLDYNKGYGVKDTSSIKIYVVDPDNGNQYLVASWK